MATYFDRYKEFRTNGDMKPMPGIVIPTELTDKQEVYKIGMTRLDKLSQTYYGNPYHGWLILQANQQFGGLEFDIPDGELIRIPFPFNNAIDRFIIEVNKHIELYGE